MLRAQEASEISGPMEWRKSDSKGACFFDREEDTGIPFLPML